MLAARIARKVSRFIKTKILSFNVLGTIKLERDNIDESELEERMAELNDAAEYYFSSRADTLREEIKKPFLADVSTPRILTLIGCIFSELIFNKNLIAVDFGCGLGWLAYYLNRLQFNVIGIDVSKTALEYAAVEFPKHEFYNLPYNYHFLHYDGFRLPLSDCSVHFIISFDAFHHIPNQAKILKEMHRILVPGGKLILSEPGIGHSNSECTVAEVEKYNVLERDTNILDFEEKARAAGFKEIYLKPFFYDIEWKLSRKDYHRLFKGVANFDLLRLIRNAMLANPIFLCKKSGDIEKSFFHKAVLKSDKNSVRVKSSEKFSLNIAVKNTGQLAFQNRYHPNGGFVTLGCKLMKDDKVLDEDLGGRIFFNKELLPGDKVVVTLSKTAPSEKGDHILHIEPVYECFYWFSEKGTTPLRIPLKVTE